MKRVAYKGFGQGAGKIVVESTGYKDPWGKALWIGSDGNYYELCYAKLARKWGAVPYVSNDGLQNAINDGYFRKEV